MQVAIVKYNAGNIYSVDYALRRIGITPIITDNRDILLNADKIIFPGQGEAQTTMAYLRKNSLDSLIKELRQPVLGICIGMQLMCTASEEGDTECLGIFDAPVVRFRPSRKEDKVPHMGWNNIYNLTSPIFPEDIEDEYVYFVHSYCVPDNSHSIATCNYVHPFSAALKRDNFYATQFHPEKSGTVGERILRSFIEL
jgi:imidazole glycerol phosphate synthase, glutamine amidotransferase subunit